MTWLFAYAELMGEHLLRSYDVRPALLTGYRRTFVHASSLLWGTPGHPCPLVGLAPGGDCWGLAFQVPWSGRRGMLRRLEPTEHSDEYRRVRLPVKLREGAEERALVWVSDPERAAPRWADEEVLEEALLAAHGTAGRGVEYVRTIVHALELWGLSDPLLESVWARLAPWRPR
jgi:glutathione-specific gamma-glutamylcyclotransferase